MDSAGQTSFIPKKPISAPSYSYSERGVSIVTIICVIIFFGTVAFAIGAYFYQKHLYAQLKQVSNNLEEARSGFEIDTIKALKRLDTRIESVKSLLDQHIAVSAYFDILENATLQTVRFNYLSLSSKSNTSVGGAAVLDNPLATTLPQNSIQFKMSGVAQSYTSVALQAELFGKTKGFKEPIFSNLGLNDTGAVTFSVAALLDPQVLRYRTAILNQSSNQTTQSQLEQNTIQQ